MIAPDKAIPFMKETFEHSLDSKEFSEQFGNEGLLTLVFLKRAYTSIGDSLNAVSHLKEAVKFVDEFKIHSPITNYLRAEKYFLDQDSKKRENSIKVIKR